MIGRFAGTGVWAEVGLRKLVEVASAAGLLLAAVLAQYVFHAPREVVIALSLGSLCLTGFPIVWGAVQGLARRTTNVDELVSIAILASMFLGEWISAAVVAWIMVLGSLIEQFTSQRARRHIEAMVERSPQHALVLMQSGETIQTPVDRLQSGQLILVRPGDVVAADGVIEEGESSIDESMLTGESVPVERGPGEHVSAGTINGEGSLKVRVERIGGESTQGKIIELVRQAELHRAPILRAAERYARWFTPVILLLSAVVWVVSGDPQRAVTILIVGCPCAFVLATPTAVIAAIGRASKQGILIKGGKYLEACAAVDLIAMDKTGTLTTGRCRVREVVPLDGMTCDEVVAQAARLEAGAEHPLARAILDHARQRQVQVLRSANIRRQAGLGISEIADRPWHLGSRRFYERHQMELEPEVRQRVESLSQQGCSVLFLSQEAALRGLLTVEDEVRAEADATLLNLRQAGYGEIFMLTGDSQEVARRVGEQLGIPNQQVYAEHLPQQKCQQLEKWEAAGRKVCYVGDGTNDGPALATATVGVSIASRENTVALETADVVLMRDGISGLPFLLNLAKATTRTINQNLIVFGLFFNAMMLLLSASGLLVPILGAIGHNIGSVAVVLNSTRLLGFKDRKSCGG